MAINYSDTATTAGAVVVRSGEGQTFRWGPEGTVRIIAGASTTDRSFSIVEQQNRQAVARRYTCIMARLKDSTFSMGRLS